jgi:hypothetical protein
MSARGRQKKETPQELVDWAKRHYHYKGRSETWYLIDLLVERAYELNRARWTGDIEMAKMLWVNSSGPSPYAPEDFAKREFQLMQSQWDIIAEAAGTFFVEDTMPTSHLSDDEVWNWIWLTLKDLIDEKDEEPEVLSEEERFRQEVRDSLKNIQARLDDLEDGMGI